LGRHGKWAIKAFADLRAVLPPIIKCDTRNGGWRQGNADGTGGRIISLLNQKLFARVE
jgi:hypothetical protein